VIALEKSHFMLRPLAPLDEIGDNSLGVGTSVYIIAEKDDPIRSFQRKGFEETSHLIQAAVNVADDVPTHDFFILSYRDPQRKALSRAEGD